jgi:5-methylcytosine-specific restriction endonuclease McrA
LQCLKKQEKNRRKWCDLVGYNVEQLKTRLELTMPDEYTWDSFLEGKLHIDHIIPISAFNFDKPEHIDFKRCWSLGNLRLLPKKENLIKNNKLLQVFQPSFRLEL